jgi:LysR family transcriptional regulator, hydrogen peroxide-inducible genes activator
MGTPTIQQLRYAVAVADERYFGRAATATHVSQPSLSAQVRELEGRLGVTLFERTTRGVLLTPAGEDLVARARRVLTEVDDLVAAAERLAEPGVGPLHLGVIPTVAPYLVPGLVSRLRRELPGIELHLHEEQTDRLQGQLADGRIDAAILALPVARPGLEERELYTEAFVLAAPKGHRLVQRGSCGPEDLATEPLVLLEEGHCLRDQALDVCSLAGREGGTEIQGTSLGTVVQMVAAGLGVTLLPASAVPVEVKGDTPVAVARFAKPRPSRTIGVVWRSSSPRSEAIHQVADLIDAPKLG